MFSAGNVLEVLLSSTSGCRPLQATMKCESNMSVSKKKLHFVAFIIQVPVCVSNIFISEYQLIINKACREMIYMICKLIG